MPDTTLAVVNAVLSGVNLLALLTTVFFGGRWAGRVDTRLDHLERRRENKL